jgi:hypothetical protein
MPDCIGPASLEPHTATHLELDAGLGKAHTFIVSLRKLEGFA